MGASSSAKWRDHWHCESYVSLWLSKCESMNAVLFHIPLPQAGKLSVSSNYTIIFKHHRYSIIKMGQGGSSPHAKCLLSAVGGNADLVAFPTKPLYQLLDVHPYNLDISVAPIAVTYPKTADQVAAIVACAGSDFKVQARGGGHSYANYGTNSLHQLKRSSDIRSVHSSNNFILSPHVFFFLV